MQEPEVTVKNVSVEKPLNTLRSCLRHRQANFNSATLKAAFASIGEIRRPRIRTVFLTFRTRPVRGHLGAILAAAGNFNDNLKKMCLQQ